MDSGYYLLRDTECTCKRPERYLTCRCRCDECNGTELKWVAWGLYLDKDLLCAACGHHQDSWDC